jgi:phage-related protein
MTSIAKHVHELRIPDEDATWRIVYRQDPDAIVVLEVFSKKSRSTPQTVIRACRRRLSAYDAL